MQRAPSSRMQPTQPFPWWRGERAHPLTVLLSSSGPAPACLCQSIILHLLLNQDEQRTTRMMERRHAAYPFTHNSGCLNPDVWPPCWGVSTRGQPPPLHPRHLQYQKHVSLGSFPFFFFFSKMFPRKSVFNLWAIYNGNRPYKMYTNV